MGKDNLSCQTLHNAIWKFFLDNIKVLPVNGDKIPHIMCVVLVCAGSHGSNTRNYVTTLINCIVRVLSIHLITIALIYRSRVLS